MSNGISRVDANKFSMRRWNFILSHLHIFWVEIACLGEMLKRFITSFREKCLDERWNGDYKSKWTNYIHSQRNWNWKLAHVADVIANCWNTRHAKITKKGKEFVSFQVGCCRFFLSFTFNSFLLIRRRSEWHGAYIDIVNIFQRSSSFNSLLFSLLFFGLSVSRLSIIEELRKYATDTISSLFP